MSHKIISAVRVKYTGDIVKAKTLDGLGKKCLFLLAQEMSFQNIPTLGRSFPFPFGTITASIAANTANIVIHVPLSVTPVVEKKKGGTIEHAYILVRIKGDYDYEEDGSVNLYHQLFPTIPMKDMCFVYDVIQREVKPDIGFVDYDSDTIKDFISKNKETVIAPLWDMEVAGQIHVEDVNPDGSIITKKSESRGVYVDTDMVTPEGEVAYAEEDNKNKDLVEFTNAEGGEFTVVCDQSDVGQKENPCSECYEPYYWVVNGRESYEETYIRSEMWVGEGYWSGDVYPVSRKLTYRGEFRGEEEINPFHTSFQVIFKSGSSMEGFWSFNEGIVSWELHSPTRKTYTINTPVGKLSEYVQLGAAEYFWYYPEPVGTGYDSAGNIIFERYGAFILVLPPVEYGNYAGPEPLPGYPYYPPWYLDDGLGGWYFENYAKSWYSKIGETISDYRETAFAGFDKRDDVVNPSGSHIMTQIYLSQMRKELADMWGYREAGPRLDLGDHGYMPLFAKTPAVHPTGIPMRFFMPEPLEELKYVDAPSDGSVFIRGKDGGVYIVDSLTEGVTPEIIAAIADKATVLGLGVAAASDYYENASDADPRSQVSDTALINAIKVLWVLVYPEEYMKAPWLYEPEEWQALARNNWGKCPLFSLHIKHFEPVTEDIEEEE